MSTTPRPRNLGLALAVIAVAQLMVVLDVAIVNVALPSIQRSLHFTATNLEWVVITNDDSWRWILFVNVPVGVGLALVAPRALLAAGGRSGRLDLPGALAVTGGATLLVYSLSRASTHGWRDATTVATLVIALALLVVFVAIEALAREPLMPLRIFANRNRSGAYLLSLAIGATLSGMLFVLTLFLQTVLRFSPLQAGFAFLPTAVGVAIGAGITSRLVGRVGARLPMTV